MTTFVDELARRVALSPEDVAHLVALQPLLEPASIVIADQFCAAVKTESGLDERLRSTITDWISTRLVDVSDQPLHRKYARVATSCVRFGVPQQQMFNAMIAVRTTYHDRILELQPLAEAIATISSANKLLDVELAILLRHYRLDASDVHAAHDGRLRAERIVSMQTLTAGLAHGVRNPLNAAKLQLELLDRRLRRASPDVRLTQPSELARIEMQRLTELLNDFLAFAHPTELYLQTHDAAEIARHVCDLERPHAEKRGIALDAPPPSAITVAQLDGTKLQVMIGNIVRNAIEATPDGGCVSVDVQSTHDELQIAVEDNGPGIPVELRGRVFEPFFTTKDVGPGLGMSVVYSLVTQHGGAVVIDSPESGARIVVTLPRRPAPE